LGAPLALIGHSAGGYLTLWAGARSAVDLGMGVALAPIVDLEDATSSGGILSREARLLLQAGAPPRVGPGRIRTVVVHGSSDQIVPLRHSQMIAGETDLLVTDGGHFELLDPGRPHWDRVVESLG
jgi:pimeloyl-ACP methyl ester carboxylesterase